jgi:hypothetical protein
MSSPQGVPPAGQSGPLRPTTQIVLTIVWVALFILLAIPTLMSVMLTDGGTTLWNLLIVYGLFALECALLLDVVALWVVWVVSRKTEDGALRIARWVTYLAPLAFAIPVIIGIVGISATQSQ